MQTAYCRLDILQNDNEQFQKLKMDKPLNIQQVKKLGSTFHILVQLYKITLKATLHKVFCKLKVEHHARCYTCKIMFSIKVDRV